jgi:hypothetical protein
MAALEVERYLAEKAMSVVQSAQVGVDMFVLAVTPAGCMAALEVERYLAEKENPGSRSFDDGGEVAPGANWGSSGTAAAGPSGQQVAVAS